jgi:UDP-glucose 4-epimerase
MKVMVTGGAGFIGSHLVDALLQAGHDVVVVDDLSTGKRENVDAAASFRELDIRSDDMGKLFAEERPEVVAHLAAQMDVRRAVREPAYDASVNVLGGLNLLECGRRTGLRKVIFASTGGAIYGEPSRLPVVESHPIAPLSPYGLTKSTFENYLALYRRLHGLDFTVLRYPNVYGPRQDPHGEAGVVAIFTGQALRGETSTIYGDGGKTRDYVHVSDVVAANMLVLERAGGEVFNVGSGEQTSDREIHQAVRDAVGSGPPPRYAAPRPGEIEHIALDGTRIREALGWKPTIGLAEGIADVVRWHRRRASMAPPRPEPGAGHQRP